MDSDLDKSQRLVGRELDDLDSVDEPPKPDAHLTFPRTLGPSFSQSLARRHPHALTSRVGLGHEITGLIHLQLPDRLVSRALNELIDRSNPWKLSTRHFYALFGSSGI